MYIIRKNNLLINLFPFTMGCAALLSTTLQAAECEYIVDNQWDSGFSAKIRITNNDNSVIQGWSVNWEYTSGNLKTSGWNANFSGGNPYSASSMAWNANIQPGQSVEFGFQGTKNNSPAEIPDVFGSVCTSNPTPVPTPTPVSIPTPVSTPTPVPSPTPVGTGVLFSDGFESEVVGEEPSGWDNFVGWVANGNNPNGSTFALVDDTRAYSGNHAMMFSGGSSPAMITRTLPEGITDVYLKAQVYMTRQLGENPGANHEHFMGLRGSVGSANNEVRFGEIKGVIGTNEVPSDNISPTINAWGTGPAYPANEWYCIEVAFLSSPAYDEVHGFINGFEVHTIDAASDWNNGALAADWLSDKFNEVIFGWHSFSGNDVDVWMDDVVISTDPIGCE